MGDSMNIWKVLMLCMVAGMLIVPVASAEEEHTLNSADKDNLVSAKNDKVDYIVSPSEDSSDTENPVSILSTQYISQGQAINHYVSVGSGVDYLEVDLNWGDTSDSLTLKIYNPSGTQIGGTYRDSSDGSVNGRIHINITPSSGDVQQGTWRFRVYGESVSGTESYTLNVYQH
ncbi:hypothetical protein [Methanosarcina sp.]|jgi:hypothetical protein|uniref:hypothetical protein n=1 Tax=Methanosarcina sp. TaxID=2213 RepID=UPI002C17AD44|nr:hypothetical protein [Methanosarcina sp.]HOW15559.1 hypothetical protein [Methanosarcina sp.]